MARKLIGPVIRKLRLDAGLPQWEVAERLGISAEYLCNIEHGRRGGVRADLPLKVAAVFGVEVSEITEPDPAEAAA